MQEDIVHARDIERMALIEIMDTLKTGQVYCEAIRLASYGIEDRELGAAFSLLAETVKLQVLEATRLANRLRVLVANLSVSADDALKI